MEKASQSPAKQAGTSNNRPQERRTPPLQKELFHRTGLAASIDGSPQVRGLTQIGADAQQSHIVRAQMKMAAWLNQPQPQPIQAMAPAQLVLDAESKLPAEEQGGVDNLLRHNGHNPDHYTLGDYQTLVQRYSRVRGLDTKLRQQATGNAMRRRRIQGEQAQARADIPGAYQEVRAAAANFELRAGNAGWNAAVTAGADAYVFNRAGGYAAAAAGAWPGRTGAAGMPAAFQNAVQAEVTARDQAVQNAFQAYINDRRLLQGTVQSIRNSLGAHPDLAAVNARLLLVYQRQTTVSREDWLLHLGIAGRRINGNARLHFTTFNDAVDNPIAGRVDNQNVQQLMDMLFLLPNYTDRLHATHVIGTDTYHKYYGGNYSANVPVGLDVTTLDHEYGRMVAHMQVLVQAAKDAHGRVGHNDRAQHVATGP